MRNVTYTEEQAERIRYLYEHTYLTIDEIASDVSLGWKVIWRYVCNNYAKDFRQQRKAQTYANSKKACKNLQFGKRGEETVHWKGGYAITDGKGYLIMPKPDWFTGRKGSKYVFVHTVVMCEALGITELPAGFVVHHVDGDRTNNQLSNLALLTNEAHTRLHTLQRNVQRPSRKGVGDKSSKSETTVAEESS